MRHAILFMPETMKMAPTDNQILENV